MTIKEDNIKEDNVNRLTEIYRHTPDDIFMEELFWDMFYDLTPEKQEKYIKRAKEASDLHSEYFDINTDTPGMKVKNPEKLAAWADLNTDDYGSTTIKFAKRWAELMESKLEEGKEFGDWVKEIAYKVSEEFGGITYNMYSAGAVILIQTWEYGDRFESWFKKDREI